jgi:hypothetical protein
MYNVNLKNLYGRSALLVWVQPQNKKKICCSVVGSFSLSGTAVPRTSWLYCVVHVCGAIWLSYYYRQTAIKLWHKAMYVYKD